MPIVDEFISLWFMVYNSHSIKGLWFMGLWVYYGHSKNLLLSGFYHSIETTLGSAELLGRLDTIDTIDTVFRYLKNMQNVHTKQIIDVLKKYLDFNFAVSVIINPEDLR